MRSGVNRTVFRGAACALLAVLPLPAAAEELPSPYLDRWIPSLAITGGITVQEQQSSLRSTCEDGGRAKIDGVDPDDQVFRSCLFLETGPKDQPLIEPDEDTDWAVSPTVGANLQLMTPGFEAIPGTPRLFVAGELVLTFPPTRDIAKVLDPGTIEVFPDFSAADSLSLSGQGAKTTSEIQTLGFGASVGIAFPFQWRGRRFWLKPSAAWLRYEVQVDGLVVVALKDDRENNVSNPFSLNTDGTACGPPTPFSIPLAAGGCNSSPTGSGSQLLDVTLSGSGSRWFHGIGPGLEIEMEAARVGPFGVSIFAGGAAYRILGNRKIKFSVTDTAINSAGLAPIFPTFRGQPGNENSDTTPDPFTKDTYNADWSFEVDPWEYRAILGVRFHWLGD